MDKKQRWTFCLGTAAVLCGIVCGDGGTWNCSKSLLILYENYTGVIRNGLNCSCRHPDFCGRPCASDDIIEDTCIISVEGNSKATTGKCYAANSTCTIDIRREENDDIKIIDKHLLEKTHSIWIPLNKTIMPSIMPSQPLGCHFKDIKPKYICKTYYEAACKDKKPGVFTLTISQSEEECVKCDDTVNEPDVTLTLPPLATQGGIISAESASEAMKSLSSMLERMGNDTTAAISMGNVKGLLRKLPKDNPEEISLGIFPNSEMVTYERKAELKGLTYSVSVSKQSVAMALTRSDSFLGVLLFPGMSQDEKNSTIMNNAVFGIDMGVRIYNLTDPIDIHYRNIDKGDSSLSCNSWNGKGQRPNWTTDGCQTVEGNNNVTCQCTHLTFFAILMSPPAKNMSSSEMTSLTYITQIGCGLSLFFLAVALFMHFSMRRDKSTNATKILVNLFIALFFLNLAFLVNESIADLGNFGGCVTIAVVLHYSMLSTFTWFFLVALHLLLQLKKVNTAVKYYMLTIYIFGWVPPALVVVVLIILGKYDLLVIQLDDRSSVNMCWITDIGVYYGVNIGYYALVFVFTSAVFVVLMTHILFAGRSKGHEARTSQNIFTLLGLCSMLGITWGFAFFSTGPLVVPSYYIFTILNSLQGFFLFLYYCKSNKTIGDSAGREFTSGSSGLSTTSTIYLDPYDNRQQL